MLLFEDIIEQYETAVAARGWGSVDLREFVPHSDSEHHWSTLVELLRVRMEHQIAAGDFHGVQRCINEYPDLREQAENLSLLAFEEYRLLNSRGVNTSPADYVKHWKVDVSKWNLEASEYHLTEEDWREAIEREATAGRFSSGDSAKRSSTRSPSPSPSPSRRRAVLDRGQIFGPFRILAELGSGALATVYLAEQLDLSERLVVLKVCSIATGEPQKIAQLQHPNIVQILSLHDVAGYQVICMPYVGATTFADILAIQTGKSKEVNARTSIQFSTTISMRQREVQTLIDCLATEIGRSPQVPQLGNSPWVERWRKLPFEQVVSELLYQAASGLEHAHQNGLVHSDLKPANILLGDDGKARLVDFNVAQQTIATATTSTVGGTLPYMAPEHLQSLLKNVWSAGPASDIYSLGVVAHQLLSGKLPFETATGQLGHVIEQAVKQREQHRPALSALQASPDLRAIIEKMIEADLSRRYQSASDLCEDLRRHLDHRPLKWAANRSLAQRFHKWTQRHPKLSSATTVASLAGLTLLAVAIAFLSVQSRLRASLATKQVAEFRASLPEVFENAAMRWAFPELAEPLSEQVESLISQLDAKTQSQSNIAWHHVSSNERARLATDLIKLKNVISQEANISPQTHQLLVKSNLTDHTEMLGKLAHEIDPLIDHSLDTRSVFETPLDRLAESLLALNAGHTEDAIELLQRSLAQDAKQPTAWLLLGYSYVKNGKLTLADHAYSSSLALAPNQWRVWFCRGLVKLEGAKLSNRREEFSEAADYFTRTLELKPSLAEARFNRAICKENLGDVQGALEDALQIVDVDRIAIPVNLFCARQYAKLGQKEFADRASKKAFGLPPKTANDYIELGTSRMALDPKQAIQDLLEANRLRPATVLILQNLAYLTMDVIPDPITADKILDDWVAAFPRSAVAVASRAVQHARQSRPKPALDDAQVATNLSPTARETAQIASVYALVACTKEEPQEAKQLRDEAFKLLATALDQDWKLVTEISRDPDLLTLRSDARLNLMLGTAASLLQLPKLARETKATSETKPE